MRRGSMPFFEPLLLLTFVSVLLAGVLSFCPENDPEKQVWVHERTVILSGMTNRTVSEGGAGLFGGGVHGQEYVTGYERTEDGRILRVVIPMDVCEVVEVLEADIGKAVVSRQTKRMNGLFDDKFQTRAVLYVPAGTVPESVRLE